jgi:hypothetical protein
LCTSGTLAIFRISLASRIEPMLKAKYLMSLAACLAVAACTNEPEVVDLNPDTMKEELAKAAPVEAPPMVQASHVYRCKDNSLAYVDFYTNNTAQFRTQKGGTAITLSSPAAGQPYLAEGYSVSSSGKQINLTAPGRGPLTCHV